jgi:hypothetical protein
MIFLCYFYGTYDFLFCIYFFTVYMGCQNRVRHMYYPLGVDIYRALE